MKKFILAVFIAFSLSGCVIPDNWQVETSYNWGHVHTQYCYGHYHSSHNHWYRDRQYYNYNRQYYRHYYRTQNNHRENRKPNKPRKPQHKPNRKPHKKPVCIKKRCERIK